MKPWEETWETVVNDDHDHDRFVVFPDDEPSPLVSTPRARLAAAAPEMARALIAWAWGETCCAKRGKQHAPDCRLVAVLRRGGVVE